MGGDVSGALELILGGVKLELIFRDGIGFSRLLTPYGGFCRNFALFPGYSRGASGPSGLHET